MVKFGLIVQKSGQGDEDGIALHLFFYPNFHIARLADFPTILENLQGKFIGGIRSATGILGRNAHLIENHLHVGGALNMVRAFEGIFAHPNFQQVGKRQTLSFNFSAHAKVAVRREAEFNGHEAPIFQHLREFTLHDVQEIFYHRLDGFCCQFAKVFCIKFFR